MLGKFFVTRVVPGRGWQYIVTRLQGAHVESFVKSWAYIILPSNVDYLLTFSSLQSYVSFILGGRGWSILQRSLFVSIVHKNSGFEPGTSWIQACYSCFSTDLLDNKLYYRKRNKYTSKSVSSVCLHLTRSAYEFRSSAATGCSVRFVVQDMSLISIGNGARTCTFGAWSATLQVRGRSANRKCFPTVRER